MSLLRPQSRKLMLGNQVAFIQNCVPVLRAGQYQLTVKQNLADKSADQKFDETFTQIYAFAAKGERFSLPATDIRSVFPPENAEGKFHDVLPQVVLNQPSLPWERTAQARPIKGKKKLKEQKAAEPWLALLLFTSADPAPEVQTLKVEDLTPAKLPPHTVSYDGLETLEYGETPADICRAIDVPIDLFNAIAPAAEDLEYLVHARQVEVKNTEEEDPDAVREVAVVTCNRMPVMGADSVAHLVSLEGMKSLLPDKEGNPSPGLLKPGIQKIRLLSLYSWKFYTQPQTRSFKEILSRLDAAQDNLVVPVPKAAAAALDPDVAQALAMGYTALKHTTRQGDRTVSWYRGPLVPGQVKLENKWPANNADALVRFDKGTGMFDISYAAAWILGRQLGLQNRLFAEKLCAWRQAKKKAAIAATARMQLGALLGKRLFAAVANKGDVRRNWLQNAMQAVAELKNWLK